MQEFTRACIIATEQCLCDLEICQIERNAVRHYSILDVMRKAYHIEPGNDLAKNKWRKIRTIARNPLSVNQDLCLRVVQGTLELSRDPLHHFRNPFCLPVSGTLMFQMEGQPNPRTSCVKILDVLRILVVMNDCPISDKLRDMLKKLLQSYHQDGEEVLKNITSIASIDQLPPSTLEFVEDADDNDDNHHEEEEDNYFDDEDFVMIVPPQAMDIDRTSEVEVPRAAPQQAGNCTSCAYATTCNDKFSHAGQAALAQPPVAPRVVEPPPVEPPRVVEPPPGVVL